MMDPVAESRSTPIADDFATLLDQLESAIPDLGSEALDREVAALLGTAFAPTRSKIAEPKRGEEARGRRRASADSEFSWFGQLVARWPVLSPAQTTAAAIEVEVGLLAGERLATSDRALLDRRIYADLYRLAEIGERSFVRLVLSNLRLVFHWSKGVAHSVDSDWAQDAFQVGCIGLMRGIQGWDHKMGFTLSTFVSWHIRQAIQRWRANDILLIRIPVHVWEAIGSDDKTLKPALRAAAARAQNIFSLDEMDGEEPWFECDGGLTEAIEELERVEVIRDALAQIDGREAAILRMRFGIGEYAEPMTLEEIGSAFGFTRERARQLETKGKAKLMAMSAVRELLG